MRSALGLFLLLVFTSSFGDEPTSISKSLSAYLLDNSLPKVSLEDWIKNNFPEASELEWKQSNCGEPYDNPKKYPDKDYPVCVDVHFKVGSCEWYGIQVLIFDKSSSRKANPKIWALYFEDLSGWELVSTLPALVNKQGKSKCN